MNKRERLMVRELPPSEQLDERLQRLGAEALSTAELLTVLIGSPYVDAGSRVLAELGGVGRLLKASPARLRAAGLTNVGLARVLAAMELARRALADAARATDVVRSPYEVATYLAHLVWDDVQEVMVVLALNAKNRIIGLREVYRGNADGIPVRIGEILRHVLELGGVSFILAHTHPSGDPTPSEEDVWMTRRIAAMARELDVKLLDHLVLGAGKWYSLREHGQLEV